MRPGDENSMRWGLDGEIALFFLYEFHKNT